jgi:DNA mismatch repair ATPase MutS
MAFDLLFGPGDLWTARHEASALWEDLRLDLLARAMAGEDKRMAEACRRVLLHSLSDARALAARGAVRMDVAAHPRLFGDWLELACEAADGAARYAEFQKPRYDHVIPNQKKLLTEIKIARLYLECLHGIHASAVKETGAFRSEAVRDLTAAVRRRFSEQNLARLEERLDKLDSLRRSDDLVLSAVVGNGLRPSGVVLSELADAAKGRRARTNEKWTSIPLSSVALVRGVEDIVQSAVYPLLQAVAGFNKDMRRFLDTLIFQLYFYLGCVRLRETLQKLGVALCEPRIDPDSKGIESEGLQNAGLALLINKPPVGNDVCFRDKRLVLITGTNQGGKTTFLRSVGLAQLMAQCGLFVTAKHYRCPPYAGMYTHFPGGEDTARGMGLLDVELKKLSAIIEIIKPRSLLLMNETFQTTMPPDAKYLADSTVRALMDSGVTVVFVTHLYAYAAGQYAGRHGDTLFLRAERGEGGSRAYVLREGEPYASADGLALFREVLER